MDEQSEGEDKAKFIVRKNPTSWLNPKLLLETGVLAAITSATGDRSSRREVLAALDTPPQNCPNVCIVELYFLRASI